MTNSNNVCDGFSKPRANWGNGGFAWGHVRCGGNILQAGGNLCRSAEMGGALPFSGSNNLTAKLESR